MVSVTGIGSDADGVGVGDRETKLSRGRPSAIREGGRPRHRAGDRRDAGQARQAAQVDVLQGDIGRRHACFAGEVDIDIAAQRREGSVERPAGRSLFPKCGRDVLIGS